MGGSGSAADAGKGAVPVSVAVPVPVAVPVAVAAKTKKDEMDARFKSLYAGSFGGPADAPAAASPLDRSRSSELVRVPHEAPLLLALVQRGHVICDLPVLYVLPRDPRSPVRREFAARQPGGSFKAVALPTELAAAVASGAGGAAAARTA